MNKKVIITLTVLAIIYWCLFDFLRWEQFDTPSFIGGARLLFGLEGGFDFQSRITKPLVLLLPGITELLTTIHPKYIFLLQNIVFFYLCGIFIYKINQIIFKDDKMAYLGMLAYTTCQPYAIFSLFVLSDVSGWFFGISGIYLTLKYFAATNVKLKHLAITGFIVGIGCLAKESAIIGLIFLFSYILLNKFSFKIKVKQFIFSFIGFIIPFAISFLLIEYFYNDSVFKRIMVVYNLNEQVNFELSNLKQIFRIIDMYWFLFIIGIVTVVKILKKQPHNNTLKSILFTGLITGILIPVWPCFTDRILFIAAPVLIIIVVYGINKFKHFGLPLVLTAGFLNIFISFIIYKYNPSGIIVTGIIIFLIVSAIFALILYKEQIIKNLTDKGLLSKK
ncbi:MAG: hypothetical protein COX07_00660 [Bacteroidetes bacterium CG23_combo_of_CG06-09_8_20_14_all_32_9]|nr:MAG: hypothetical protein COX07_00660 [Bacteroidetes bacterium CG23_combo_of_CG06-09_8_20_14_all_32_9]